MHNTNGNFSGIFRNFGMCARAQKIFLVGVVNWLKWAEMCSLHPTPFPDTKLGEAFCRHTPKFRKIPEMLPENDAVHDA